MPSLTINGQQVTVGPEFDKLSPDEQNAAVDEIAKSLGPAPGGTSQRAGSFATGANDRLAQLAGAPVDAATWLINKAYNYATAPTVEAGGSGILASARNVLQGRMPWEGYFTPEARQEAAQRAPLIERGFGGGQDFRKLEEATVGRTEP